ncbi:MAG TPA: helix-turn-helix transcriptional regulator [Micromonosporaceae bacterium]|nr:helix-turn-helix transcriptional regulator [Micromonosporaceae bacterium]
MPVIDTPPTELTRFAAELLRWRRQRGMTQQALADAVLVSRSLVHKVEKAARWPTPRFATACDAVLRTGGTLEQLIPAVEATRLAHDQRRRGTPRRSTDATATPVDPELLHAVLRVTPQSTRVRTVLSTGTGPPPEQDGAFLHRVGAAPPTARRDGGQQPRAPCCPHRIPSAVPPRRRPMKTGPASSRGRRTARRDDVQVRSSAAGFPPLSKE